ncbi:Flp family type IVb pilin [Candidatus Poriferisodalis sp.]|uniref:Flp family type IVb pilin n=1 Tax=Candidatus Poriferisodalis sp. TaxID=3101277 RepID=UPI003B51853D
MTEPMTNLPWSAHTPLRRTHRLDAGEADKANTANKANKANEANEAGEADEAGQTTAEYALLTGAIALLVAAVTAWATSTGKIGRLLDAVFNYLTKAIS